MKTMTLRRSLLLGAGLAAMLASGPALSAEHGGKLIYGIGEDIQHFDPALLPAVNFPIIPQLFDSVVRLDEKTEPQPGLAESWEFSDDGLSLTLHLRDDVVFHDGTPLTAEDIAWNIARYQDPETGANARVLMMAITSAEAADDHTLVLGFDAPQAAIFDGLDLLYVIKPTEDLDGVRANPVGTGPFKLERRAPGDSISFVRNDDYWNGDMPYLDAVEMRVLPDSFSGTVAIETGEINLLGTPPEDELGRLADIDGLEVLQAGSPSVVRDVIFNVESDGPFGNKLVRQAVHYAIDRDRVIDVVRAGQSEPWCLPWHNGSIAFTPADRDCPRDVEKAKALLAEAGYPDGFETSIVTGANEESILVAQILAANLADIGIVAQIDQVEVPQERWRAGTFEISVHGYGRANRDPATLLTTTSVFRPSNNFARYASEEYSTLVNGIATTIDDPEGRKAMLADLDALMLDEMWVVSVAPNFMAYAHEDEVEGLRVNLDGMPFLEGVWLDQ